MNILITSWESEDKNTCWQSVNYLLKYISCLHKMSLYDNADGNAYTQSDYYCIAVTLFSLIYMVNID